MNSQSTYFKGIVSVEPDCDKCPLRYKRKVLPDGPIPARIAFVGEGPGHYEERQGRGFVGPSGNLLWDHIGPAIGMRREDVWVSNSALCRPEPVKLSSGAVLPIDTVKELSRLCCHRRLIEELRAVNPEVIVPLGRLALKSLSGIPNASIYAYRGSRMEIDLHAMAEQLEKERLGMYTNAI